MQYRFQVQRIGPVKLVFGGLLVAGLLLGAVLFASAVAIVGLIAGLAVSAAGLLAYGVRRFLNPKPEENLERRAEALVIVERTEGANVRSIEVEVVED